MKQKNTSNDLLIITIFLVSLGVGIIFFFLLFLNKDSEAKTMPQSNTSPKVEDININKIVEDIKKENASLEYESENIKEFVSLVFKENNRYKNIIVDTKTGKKLNFEDIIKKDKINYFNMKEQELLNLKYPTFIVNGINSSNGYKIYYVKDNEVIIFYYDYSFLYPLNEEISLRINYNEVKDYLNFSPNLDDVYENEDGYNYSKNKKAIALTFDDGPSRKYNPLILNELKKNKAHATFFMVGNMMNNCGKCILETVKSGSEVGSHTYEHINIKRNDIKTVNYSLNRTNEIYKKITGEDIKYLRPPYGAYNKTNLDNINTPIVLWDLDTEDWRYRNVDYIVNYIVENAHDGGVILMHELYETSYEALKIALPKLYSMGYQVVSISELAKLKNRTLEPGKAYRHF